MHFNIIIVGAGITGLTLAERFANIDNSKVLIIEKRNHIGGNCYDFYNEAGHLVHLYGPHIFHTKIKRVWEYLSNFTEWRIYFHKVLSFVNGEYIPFPINIDTINKLFNTNYNALNINEFFEKVRIKIKEPKNAKEQVISKIGEELYKLFFEGYTIKQWGISPEKLDPSVTARIPLRFNRDKNYFADQYQGMPKYGYTKMFENMIKNKNIKILLNTEFEEIKNEIKYDILIYTGPIDKFFNYKFGKLPYRSLKFKFEIINQEYFQPVATVNYPINFNFTRITEFKHLTGQKSETTTILKEFPSQEGEPFYPVLTEESKVIYEKYYKESLKLKNIFFAGRLGNFKYYNMDVAVDNALNLYEKISGK